MTFDLIDLLKVGGPVLTLAIVVIWLNDRRFGQLIKMVSNHLEHTDSKLETVANETAGTRTSIDRLIDRIDRMLTRGTY